MKTAMILAAGRGERLRPVTDHHPKALCRVHHTPLIEYHVAHLAKAGFQRLVINHAYLGGQIRRCLGNGERWNIDICYSAEPPGGLETGGGIAHALPLLGNEPFITVNADIFTDYDFKALQRARNSRAHLILVKQSTLKKDFGLTSTHHLDNKNKKYTFAGIACYDPIIFRKLHPGRYSITPLLRELADKQQATGEVYAGKWVDIGTPEGLLRANRCCK